MTTTTFQNGVTLTDDDWFNDVDFLVYDLFGDSTTTASAAARIAGAFANVTVGGTLSVSAGAYFGGIISASAAANFAAALNVAGTASISALNVVGVVSLSAVAGSGVATQANMESAISAGAVTLIVTPGRLQYHPGVAKAWVRFDGTATSVTAAAGAYNIASITDKGAGNYNIIFTTPFSSNLYAPHLSANLYNAKITSLSTVSAEITLVDLSGTAADASIVAFVAFGDQ